MNTTQSSYGGTHPAPSAPVFVDLLSDDPNWNAATPTATALDASMYHGTSTKDDETIVVIPSSGVLLESSYAATASVANEHRAPTTTSTPYPSSPYTASGSLSSPSSTSARPTEAIATPYNPHQRYFKGKRVKPKNAHLPDAVLEFKEKRKRRTVVATCTGGAVGLIFLGPFGGVLGATGAYAAAKTVGKRRERRLTEKATLQEQYRSSSAAEEFLPPNSPMSTALVQSPIDRAELA
jgi:hypothetical protein